MIGLRDGGRPARAWRHASSDPFLSTAEPVLKGGASWRIRLEYVDAAGRTDWEERGEDAATVEFLDAAGLRWRRTGSAQPVRRL